MNTPITTPAVTNLLPNFAFNQWCDRVDETILRANGALNIMALHFSGEGQGSLINPELIYWALQSICYEVDSIRSALDELHSHVFPEATKTCGQS